MVGPEDVLKFWLEDCGPAEWYAGGEALDADIRAKFESAWHAALAGKLSHWDTTPRGALALLILTDQFSRNMFRGTAQAFATDPLARACAKAAIDKGFDLRIQEPERQFFYLPLEHSECLADQERAVRLIKERMNAPETLLHARAHREIIRTFGRFPFRNAALGRTSTDAEKAFVVGGGYGPVVQALRTAA